MIKLIILTRFVVVSQLKRVVLTYYFHTSNHQCQVSTISNKLQSLKEEKCCISSVVFVVGSMVVANTINTGCVDLLVIGRERPKQLVPQFDKFLKFRISNILPTHA